MKALPEELLKSLKGLPGFDEQAFIECHQQQNRITSIRLNPFKRIDLDMELSRKVEWCEGGFYLNERPSFTHDPLFHAGCYYVQEAGSMFLEHVLKHTVNLTENIRVLDLCAAPGGKSTLINSLLNPESLLVANEIVKGRADVLAYNLSKWGTCNSVVTNNDPQKFSGLSDYFDVIVVDAPCSGSGLFRKQPEAIDEWSLQNVQMCCGRQRQIVDDILPALKENGILIYSTCSYSVEENEVMTDYLTGKGMEYIPLPVEAEWGIVDTGKGYRFYPHQTEAEGFFCAVFRKSFSSGYSRDEKLKENRLDKNEAAIMAEFFDADGKQFFKHDSRIHFMNAAAARFLSGAGKHFYLKKAGVIAGEIKGKDLVPNHELALSVDCRANKLSLSKEDALCYLRKQSFNAGEKQRGFTLISYRDFGIGWAKLLENRANNYLPNEYRIIN